ncbi:molybdopterin-guanine dinucleotide biosynthesis protein B [Magnetospirillum sulfuroxidans]|uniref:Molybdopterin-guanine dinucleotide biosynthesis protein B n=1 Tax=Magnetospirillum sulfuroxidans TaxID=611300 RepID=A0ABS5I7L1_9PROT|nr:molybdopterin-guanine dinucleotide biosynthesis protein B [Magnetospirillum sulfuroxidans]MBR9970417.1 molybdopterin-guanine dinucleotide biosynthesis protein B [Magnetospirillum sulfuroxidans]
MKVFGIAGWSGSGKTTLIKALLPVLSARGLRVGTVKHTHHDPVFGTQSDALLATAGLVETMMVSTDRFTLVHEHQGQSEPPLPSLLSALAGIDLVLVEGFKFSRHPRLEIWDSALQHPLMAVSDRSVRAVVSDDSGDGLSGLVIPRFHRHEIMPIAEFIVSNCIPLSELE